MVNAIVGTNNAVNSIHFMLQSQSDDASDTDNDDDDASGASVSTPATDGSVNALRRFTSSRNSSRRSSDFSVKSSMRRRPIEIHIRNT